jgi:hypothetical protein
MTYRVTAGAFVRDDEQAFEALFRLFEREVCIGGSCASSAIQVRRKTRSSCGPSTALTCSGVECCRGACAMTPIHAAHAKLPASGAEESSARD